jgi:hypothetical protein
MERRSEHRTFTKEQKEECWSRAGKIEGRDPSRWRYDAVRNPVLKKLRGCFGKMCHEYDHIKPFSKGGETVVENCQILQTVVNRKKGNKQDSLEVITEGMQREYYSNREMDFIEECIYGNVSKKYE